MLSSFTTSSAVGVPWSFNYAKHGLWLLWLVSPGVLQPTGMETMLSSREVWWVDWFSSGTVLALGHIADLLSMVFLFWCTKSSGGGWL